ncbi:hypothetical protein [Deinococcus budaensis]|uniref:Uncharacterized protein n=1 Tax=Deinococcus budaensis TaxID=1665626 RepID=A0A7W8GH40_9DEIO|nr:hypothetical protein [Deinococcus budaensis]MBB5235525.1 hypothetical protein [Deinococcus budaensis]
MHIGSGWQTALADLEGPGRRWLVSPWVNSGDTDLQGLLNLVRPGDRLLLRGRPEDFLHRMSSFGAVEQFLARQVEVQRFSHLHAKVYAREEPGGGVVWLGSANLTRRGRQGDTRAHGNYEAMSGPHLLTPTGLGQLQALWARSVPFDRAAIEGQVGRLREEREEYATLLGEQALTTLTLQVGFKLLNGQLTLSPKWLGMPPLPGVTYPAVKFVTGDVDLARRLRRLKHRAQRGLRPLAVPVDGSPGLHVLPVTNRDAVERGLRSLQRQAQDELGPQLDAQRPGLKARFLERFEAAFLEFTRAHRAQARPLAELLVEASEAFDAYIGQDPFALAVRFGVPLPNLHDPYDPLAQSVIQAHTLPRPLR